MIYLDNSATTMYKPPEVIKSVTAALKYLSANPGRSGHSLSVKAGQLVYKTREHAAEYLGASLPERVIFTSGCTAALNTAIFGSVKIGGNVVTTAYEHNSVLRPLFELKRRGLISVTVLSPDGRGDITCEAVEKALRPETYLIAVNHISNVTGAVMPIESIAGLARRKGILSLVDGAQSVGYEPLRLSDTFVDMLAVAPHKGLHAPQGVGLLALSGGVALKPLIFGGTGVMSESLFQPGDLPESLESGTLPTPAIAGLSAALFWSEKCREDMRQKLRELSAFLLGELKKIEGVTVYTPLSVFNGIVSFNIGSLHSQDAATVLSEQYDICVRGGLHCAPLIHKHLNTLERGIIRASLGIDNTYAELSYFVNAVKELSRNA